MNQAPHPDRQAAFPDRSLASFAGDFHQLRAICATVAVRNSLEDHHAGITAEPGAIVSWPGGQCRYSDAARISPNAIFGFSRDANAMIARDLANVTALGAGGDSKALFDFNYRALCASKWFLPEASANLVRRLTCDIRRQLPANAWASRAREAAVAERCLDQEGFIRDFFASHTAGHAGPDDAARRGEEVHVDTSRGRVTWGDVSHISNQEIMEFNIALGDHILSVIDATEEAAHILQKNRQKAKGRSCAR